MGRLKNCMDRRRKRSSKSFSQMFERYRNSKVPRASLYLRFLPDSPSRPPSSPIKVESSIAPPPELDLVGQCSMFLEIEPSRPPGEVTVIENSSLASADAAPPLEICEDFIPCTGESIYHDPADAAATTAALRICSTNKKKRRKLASETSSTLPQEILTNILQRLPVKSLVRFKSVCKSWLTLLSSRSFIDRHLDFTKRERCTRILLSPRMDIAGATLSHLTVDFYSYLVGSCEASMFRKSLPLKYKPNMLDTLHFWHCDGLLVFAIGPQIHVCNPTTGEFRALPMGSICARHDVVDESHRIGFGFDPYEEEYKVIRLIYRPYWSVDGTVCYGLCCEIFTLNGRDNSWKTIEGEPLPCQVKGYSPTFHDGLAFWKIDNASLLSSSDEACSLLCLNLRDEKFRIVPCFPDDRLSKHKEFTLWEADGSICIAMYVKQDIQLLTLKKDCDYTNIKLSDWILLHIIYLPKVSKSIEPIGILNREILLRTERCLMLRNPYPTPQRLRDVLDIHPDFIYYSQKTGFRSKWHSTHHYEATSFIESLVSTIGR